MSQKQNRASHLDSQKSSDTTASESVPADVRKDADREELLAKIPREGDSLKIYRSAWSGVRAIQYSE